MATSIESRKAQRDISNDAASAFFIPDTRKKITLTYLKPYTMERLTEVWGEVEESQAAHDAPETLKYACKYTLKPYKEAVLYTLNSYWKIRLFYRLKVWWWAYVRQFTAEQMNAIVREGKKKIIEILKSYYENMVSTLDMRADWMKMTQKEAEQYRAELISAAERLSSKNTPNSDIHEGSSSD